jgi:hypothetical protein
MKMAAVFLSDLADSAAQVLANPKSFPDGLAPLYGMTATIPDRSVVTDVAISVLDGMIPTK